ncbi:hypothetical protein MMC07_004923 [Pseudocyphellaria aurata]|nr:hypothetical protein [Pseudocyphellaria aurata]
MVFVRNLGRKRSVAKYTRVPSLDDIVEKDGVEMQRELGTDCQISELAEERRSTESRPESSSTNDAPQESKKEIISDTSSVSPLSYSNSSNEALSPLSDRSVCSSIETMIDQTLDVLTSTPNLGSFQARGLTRQQTAFCKGEKIFGLITRFSVMDRDSSGYILTATEELFDDLRSKVDFVSQRWMLLLDPPHNSDIRSFLSKPFKKGIQALQNFYRGTLPRTFESIFALMHIVHACALIYHKTDETPFWHTLFLSVIQWRYAIATPEDVSLFLRAAFLLWADPESSLAEVAEKYNEFSVQLRWSHTQQSGPQAYDDLDMLDLSRVRDMLREGEAIGQCTRYLDDFDYEKIGARKAVGTNYPAQEAEWSSENNQTMQTSIIDKLLQWERVESFRTLIIEAQSDLRCGLLLNPHEVEVKLAKRGWSGNQPQSAYNEYRKFVGSLCNNAMFSSTPNWRDRYYAKNLDEVLLMLDKFQRRQPLIEKFDLIERQFKPSLPIISSPGASSTDSSPTSFFSGSSCNSSSTSLASDITASR